MKRETVKPVFFKGETALRTEAEAGYAASFVRFSTRHYSAEPISAPDREAVDALAVRINAFDDGIRAVPVYGAAPELFESFGYTKLSGVPAFLAILGKREKFADVKAGFYGEALCLALTRRNLKTCWVSGSIKKQMLKEYIEISRDERFLTSIVFGYGENRTPEAIAERRKRKPLDRIFAGELTDERTRKLMTCVQNAPSAINRQPWQYAKESGCLAVRKPVIPGGPFPEALDIGISMLHATFAGEALGMAGVWKKADGGNLAVFSMSAV